jgi:hypothetical protein
MLAQSFPRRTIARTSSLQVVAFMLNLIAYNLIRIPKLIAGS